MQFHIKSTSRDTTANKRVASRQRSTMETAGRAEGDDHTMATAETHMNKPVLTINSSTPVGVRIKTEAE